MGQDDKKELARKEQRSEKLENFQPLCHVFGRTVVLKKDWEYRV